MYEANMKDKKALAYVRISSMRQIDNESPDTQRSAIQRYADDHNTEIIKWYFDEAKSGKSADREDLQNLLQYAVANKDKVDYVLVYNMRRMSRDLESFIQQIKVVLNKCGISIRSATESVVDDTKMGRFMENLLVILGQLDNEGKAEVTIDNMKSLAFQGYWQHPPTIGYITVKIANESGKPRPSLAPNKMAEKVRATLERYSIGDMTKAELTRYAASIGLRSRYGNKLSEDSIHRLIKSWTHAGYVSDRFTGYEPIKGKHPAIISLETFERNQQISTHGATRTGEIRLRERSDYPLKGLLLCPNCNKPLYASAPQTGSGGKSPRYHCSRASCKGKYKSIKAETIHKQFETLLEIIQPSEQILGLYKTILVREANNELGRLNSRIKTVRSDLSEIDELRVKTIKKFAEDTITVEEKNDLTNSLDHQKSDKTTLLKELESQQKLREADIDFAINVMRNVSKQWSGSDFDIQMRFQKMIFPEGVTYDSATSKFGTTKISPLYRCIPNKKDSEVASKSFLVAGSGFEPLT